MPMPPGVALGISSGVPTRVTCFPHPLAGVALGSDEEAADRGCSFRTETPERGGQPSRAGELGEAPSYTPAISGQPRHGHSLPALHVTDCWHLPRACPQGAGPVGKTPFSKWSQEGAAGAWLGRSLQQRGPCSCRASASARPAP